MLSSKSEVEYLSYDEVYGEGFEDMQRRVPDIEKAKRLIGFQPTQTLENIINDVADQFREEIKTDSKSA